MAPEPLWLRWLKSEDRALNVFPFFGDDNETISHRVARARARGLWWGKAACWLLKQLPWWPNHCDDVLLHPNSADAQIPVDAPLVGDTDPPKDKSHA